MMQEHLVEAWEQLLSEHLYSQAWDIPAGFCLPEPYHIGGCI